MIESLAGNFGAGIEMVTDATESRYAQILQQREKIRPGFSIVEDDRQLKLLSDQQLFAQRVPLIVGIIPSIPEVQANFTNGQDFTVLRRMLQFSLQLGEGVCLAFFKEKGMQAQCGENMRPFRQF